MNRKNKKPFVGRIEELAQLRGLANAQRSALAVIKGRRRIGKSRLVAEFAKDKIFLSLAGPAPINGITAQDQRDVFARQLAVHFSPPPRSVTDWFDAFTYLNTLLKEQLKGVH